MALQEFIASGSRYPTAQIRSEVWFGRDDHTPLGTWSYTAALSGVNSEIPIIFAEQVFDPKNYAIGKRAYTGEHNPAPNPLYDEPFTEVSAWMADPFGLEDDPVPDSCPADGFDLDGQSIASLTAVPAPPAAGLFPAMLVAVARFAIRTRSSSRWTSSCVSPHCCPGPGRISSGVSRRGVHRRAVPVLRFR